MQLLAHGIVPADLRPEAVTYYTKIFSGQDVLLWPLQCALTPEGAPAPVAWTRARVVSRRIACIHRRHCKAADVRVRCPVPAATALSAPFSVPPSAS